jgi:hypothetical protein
LEVHNCVAAFTSQGKLHEFGAEKPISWAKSAHFEFFTINFAVWSHILSTGGDALRLHTPLWNLPSTSHCAWWDEMPVTNLHGPGWVRRNFWKGSEMGRMAWI